MPDHPATTAAIIEEFGHDLEALAAEILALRRVVAELHSLRDDQRPFIVVSPPDPPEAPDPPDRWPPIAPRAVVRW